MGRKPIEKSERKSFKDWYEKNGGELNKSRRDRYKTDPAYREEVLQRNRDARRLKRESTLTERKESLAAKGVTTRPLWKTVEVMVDGKTVTAFTIGALARSLGRSVQAIRLWERQGIIPEAPIRNVKGDRFYPLDSIEAIRKLLKKAGKLEAGDTPAQSREGPKGVRRMVEFADGTQRKLLLFRIGTMADAVGRTAVTLEQLERDEVLPATPFRASSTRYRLYSTKMIASVRDAFQKRNYDIKGDAWNDFRQEVLGAWEKQGVLSAKLIPNPGEFDPEPNPEDETE